MKKIIFAFALSVFTMDVCHAQLTHISQFIKLPLPNGVNKLTNQQLDSLKSIKSVIANVPKTYPPYLYKQGNILLGFFNVNSDSTNNDISKKKLFQDEGHGFLKRENNNTYTSIIKNLNNKQVLIINYAFNNWGHYKLYYYNETKTKCLTGYIDYPSADAAKAEVLLNAILNNLQFTQ